MIFLFFYRLSENGPNHIVSFCVLLSFCFTVIYVTKYSSDVPGQRQEKHRENGNAESPKRCLK